MYNRFLFAVDAVKTRGINDRNADAECRWLYKQESRLVVIKNNEYQKMVAVSCQDSP